MSADPGSEHDASTSSGIVAPRARVMVVEDDDSVADVLREVLGEEAFELTFVASGEEAMRHLASGCPDLILTDISLPGKSGLDVMRAARHADPEVAVVLMTGHATVQTSIDALREGASDYITKPFDDITEIPKTLERHLRNRRLKVENRALFDQLQRQNEVMKGHEQELRNRIALATRNLDTLYRVSMEIGANLELLPRLARIVETAARLVGARAAVVYLQSEDNNEYRAAAVHGVELPLDDPVLPHFVAGQGWLGQAVESQLPVRLAASGSADRELPGAARSPATCSPAHGAGTPRHRRARRVDGAAGSPTTLGSCACSPRRPRSGAQLAAVRAHEGAGPAQIRLRRRGLARDPHAAHVRQGCSRAALGQPLLREHRTAGQAAVHRARECGAAAAVDQRHPRLLQAGIGVAAHEHRAPAAGTGRAAGGAEPAHAAGGAPHPARDRGAHAPAGGPARPAPRHAGGHEPAVQCHQVLAARRARAHRASASEEVRRLSVRDNGDGIASKDLPRLFKKFQQIDSGSTRKVGGTGLGLVISKGIIEQHGGRIGVESLPGEGSTFWFTLPVAPSSDGELGEAA
jgi:DNA-binding response OmpR family regulator